MLIWLDADSLWQSWISFITRLFREAMLSVDATMLLMKCSGE
jgi:hypothetical protein